MTNKNNHPLIKEAATEMGVAKLKEFKTTAKQILQAVSDRQRWIKNRQDQLVALDNRYIM